MEESANAIRSLVEGIRFLSAVRAQLNGEKDRVLLAEERYGHLVPALGLTHLSSWELGRVEEEQQTEDSFLAYELKLAIEALRDLIRRHERSRSLEPRLLHWYVGAPYMREDELVERLVALGLPVSPLMRALSIARDVHRDQKRDDGSPYLEEHIYPVTYEVARYQSMHASTEPLTSTLVAILHDSMEDGDPSLVSLSIEYELGEEVLELVKGLTKPPKSDFAGIPLDEAKQAREAKYMALVQELPDHIRLVKVIDRINNLLCVHKSPSKIEGYVEETIRFHLPLAASIDSELVEQMGFLVESLQRRLEIDSPSEDSSGPDA